MTNLEIAKEVELLSSQIKNAAATMDYKTTIVELRKKIVELQSQCTHDSNYQDGGKCQYCGKRP